MTDTPALRDVVAEFYAARPPARLGVAVSGGSDSLALLHLLHEWGGAPLSAVTVNHGLRPEAASEALHVEHVCQGLGIPHRILEWQGWDGKGNLQDQARRNRYALIADWAREEGLSAVAIGHTQDDQAETFLMRLARASGVDGLSAMAAEASIEGITIHRPLLAARRGDLRRHLEARGVRWVEDPSNEDLAFERVRAREVLQALSPLGIDAATLGEVAANLRQASDALGRVAADWAQSHIKVIAGDIVFDRTALLALPPELIHRLVAAALRWVASADYPPRRDALARLVAALRQAPDSPNMTLHGCLAMISGMTLRITREYAAVAELSAPPGAPWDTRWTLEGPGDSHLEIRALGEAVKQCPDWRATRLPRATLLASPSVWEGDRLIAAPLAGLGTGWTAKTQDQGDFVTFLIAR